MSLQCTKKISKKLTRDISLSYARERITNYKQKHHSMCCKCQKQECLVTIQINIQKVHLNKFKFK